MSDTSKNKVFTKDQINKIGNAVIYLSRTITDLNKTKILKLLFLLEEACIKKYGHPFFAIDFQLWKHGPVVKDIFIDLSDDQPTLLKDYIERDTQNLSIFKPKADFCDDEFSENDIDLMDKITHFAHDKSASYLVKHTHGTNSLWRKSALQYGILELLENELINSTEHEIDFSLLFDNPSTPTYLKERFEESKENHDFVKRLKK